MTTTETHDAGRNAELAQIRPLVVTTRPHHDEALCSVMARATRANVLGTTQIILREVGLQLAHPGTIGQEIGELAQRFADKVGCDPAEVERLAHPYADEKRTLVRWGEGILRRSDLLLDRRRIAPSALVKNPYVRAAWQCRHLPYDAETGELLLDTCPRCEKTLRWSQAWGVGVCEHCRTDLTKVDRPVLEGALLIPYRAFADMISIVPETRSNARSELSPELAALPQPVLMDLITALGVVLGAETRPTGRRRLRQLADHERVKAIARGMSLIADWPRTLRSRLANVGRCDQGGHVVAAVRSLGHERAFASEQTRIVRAALPKAFQDNRRVLGSLEGPVVLPREVAESAGLRAHQIRHLADAGMLPVLRETGSVRRNIQLAAEPAMEFARRRRDSIPLTAVERWLGVPRYGVELLIDAGLLRQETHPGILLLESVPRVTRASYDGLRSTLESRILPASTGADQTTLRMLSRRIGGGLKPWDRIFEAIVDGSLAVFEATPSAASPFIKRVSVQHDLASCFTAEFKCRPVSANPAVRNASQLEACEILNLDSLQIRPLVEAGRLDFRKEGRGFSCPVADVLAYAAEMIAPAELAHRLETRADAVHAVVDGWSGVKRIPGGWKRTQVEEILAGREVRRANGERHPRQTKTRHDEWHDLIERVK